jgi:hypothetical protein
MSSNRRDRNKKIPRRTPFREPKRRLLVVCEGKNTEPQYINGLAQYYRNTILQITIPPEQGDPKKLVEMAKKNTEDAASNARRNKDENLKYDETWCVYDKDDHERFGDACRMARDNGFKLAISNPSFELWLLLHFRESPGRQHRDKIKAILSREFPGYDKKVDFRLYAVGLSAAGARAKRIHDEALRDGEKEFDNPSTSMFCLVGSMLKEIKEQELFKDWAWLQQLLAE